MGLVGTSDWQGEREEKQWTGEKNADTCTALQLGFRTSAGAERKGCVDLGSGGKQYAWLLWLVGWKEVVEWVRRRGQKKVSGIE